MFIEKNRPFTEALSEVTDWLSVENFGPAPMFVGPAGARALMRGWTEVGWAKIKWIGSV